MTVDEILKARLGVESLDDETQLARNQIKQEILEFCHIKGVPPGLDFVWADMTLALLSSWRQEKSVQKGDAPFAGALSSVSMGDTSYHFNASAYGKTNTERINAIVGNYKAKLVKYRRGLFGRDPYS